MLGNRLSEYLTLGFDPNDDHLEVFDHAVPDLFCPAIDRDIVLAHAPGHREAIRLDRFWQCFHRGIPGNLTFSATQRLSTADWPQRRGGCLAQSLDAPHLSGQEAEREFRRDAFTAAENERAVTQRKCRKRADDRVVVQLPAGNTLHVKRRRSTPLEPAPQLDRHCVAGSRAGQTLPSAKHPVSSG